MLTEKENILFKIFCNIYEMKITNNIVEEYPDMNIIFDEEHITTTLLNKIYKRIETITETLLENSLINSIQTNNKIVLELFLKEKINNIELLNEEEKRQILYTAIQNLLEKKNYNINELEINRIKRDNIELFLNINNFNNIKSLNDTYRETIINLAEFLRLEYNKELLELILLTNKYDNELKIVNPSLITEKDIKLFKLYLIRIILCDVFISEIYITTKLKETTPELFEDKDFVTTSHVTHITKCINNNRYTLPSDQFEREQTLNKYVFSTSFPDYNALNFVEQYYKKELKKINPLYILDKIKY